MFYIDRLTGEVDLNRGDNATFTLHINSGDNLNPVQYRLQEKDCIYLAIEEPNQPFENAIVKKVINLQNNILDKDGNITFDLDSDDTLLLMPGLYYYEIKAKLYNDNQYRNGYLTIIFRDNFEYQIIDEESMKCISNGTFSEDEEKFIFTEDETENIYEAVKRPNYLTFNYYPNVIFSNLTFKHQEDKVNTIIPQTKFIVER